jgi:SAM-dependent methyltransferase
MSAAGEPDAYLLGTGAPELNRLGFQHRVWAADTHALWRRAGVGPGQAWIDVGCGPGFATIDLAQLVSPGGRVLAVDRSRAFLQHLTARAAQEGLADVVDARPAELDALTLEPASLDGAYARWVLCFLAEPRRLLDELGRAVRPGGRLVVQDYASYRSMTLAPRSARLDAVSAAIGESWRRQGGDLDVGERLPGWLEERGWRVRDVRPAVHAARPGSPHWEWLTRFFTGYLPRVVELGLLAPGDLDAFLAEWRERAGQPGTFFLTPPVLEVVAERRAS